MAEQKASTPSDRFTLRVLTPAGLVFEEQVTNVTLPAYEGEIGVLPGHVRYIGMLGVGLLRYDLVGGTKGKPVVTTGGFCNFADGILTILADSVDSSETTERTFATTLKTEAEKSLASLSSYDDAWEVAAMKRKRAEALEQLLH